MSPSPREKRRATPTRAICAPASTNTGSRLRNDANLEPNPVVDDPRIPAAAESLVRVPLPLLSQLLLLHAYGDRTIRSLARFMARPASPAALSSLQRGRLRPRAGQENNQCLTSACFFGLHLPRSCISTTKRGCMTIRPRASATPPVSPPPAPPVPPAISATRCRRPQAARRRRRRPERQPPPPRRPPPPRARSLLRRRRPALRR